MKASKHDHSKGVWLLCTLLYVVVFNYPFVQIFNRVKSIFGIPLVILCLLGGWLLFIAVIFLFVRKLNRHIEDASSEDEEEQSRPCL